MRAAAGRGGVVRPDELGIGGIRDIPRGDVAAADAKTGIHPVVGLIDDRVVNVLSLEAVLAVLLAR